MLAGEGQYSANDQQLAYEGGAYAQISAAAKRAWYKLPATGRQTEDLSKIRQGPDEPFQEFVAQLMETAHRLIGDAEAGMLLVKQLAYENANSACQAALRPYRKKGDMSDYIRLCSDIGPAYTQDLAMAAAFQGKTVKEVLFQQTRNSRSKSFGGPGCCFECQQRGHFARNCPQSRSPQKPLPRSPGLCLKCEKGYHWA